ncbi:MAG: RNA polymerase sigma factor [Fimbriimonas sp.]
MMEREREEELVRAATRGDLAAFDTLVTHYRPAAIALARQIVRSNERAEDTAQDALITAFKALPQLQDPTRFAAWLAAIVRHRAKRISQSREDQAIALDEFIAQRVPALQAKEIRNEVSCAIEDLPEEQRIPAQLFYLQEWSTLQISEFLSLPITTVKWRLHMARKSLRPRLAESLEIEQ